MSRYLACLALIGLFLTGTAQAQQLYRVEIILFAHNDTAAAHSELWPVAERPDLSRAIDLGKSQTDFHAVGAQELTLGGVASRLDQSGNYRVIRHLSWIQPGLSEKSARPVNISVGDVEGTLTLVLGRYLHLRSDLVYRTQVNGRAVAAKVAGSRRMKSRELHYIDHPLLGILVEVTPVE